MYERDPNYHHSGQAIEPALAARIGKYTILDRGEFKSQLVIAEGALFRAGIISGPEGDEFDLDAAIETIRENAFDPTLN